MTNNKKDTLVAFLRLFCTLVTSGATMFGIALDVDTLYIIVLAVVSLVAFLWSWWKNNNVTAAASEAQELLGIAKVTVNRAGEDAIEEE